MNQSAALRVPDHLSRADIGAYMRDLRVHYGLNEQDVSQRLHIRVKYVTAIESADFDAMPGRAYARGYVHTYAEFLGLDADQVVERCFGVEPVREAAPLPKAAVKKAGLRMHWSIPVIFFVVIGVIAAMQQNHSSATPQEQANLAPVDVVPEEYLAGLRTQFMPAPDSYGCLGEQSPLGCFTSGRLLRSFIVPRPVPDMAPVRVDPPVPEAPAEAPVTPEAGAE